MAKKEEDKGLTPTEVLNARLDELENNGMERTKKWVDMWNTSQRYFFSDQLQNKRTHKDWDWIILNYIWPSAFQEISKLSKNHPKILTEPFEESDIDFAEAWQGVLQWLWEKGVNGKGMRLEQIAAILDGKIYGYRVSKVFWEGKVFWDDNTKRWVGDVKHRLWNPANFWADGVEKIDDGNCGTVRYVSLDYAINRWPDHKTALEEQAKTYKEITTGGDHIRGQLGSAGTYPSAGTGGIDKGVGAGGSKQLLNLILGAESRNWDDKTKILKLSEIYFRDYKEKKIVEEEPIPAQELLATGAITSEGGIYYTAENGEPIEPENWPTRVVREYNQPTYPNGRYIIRAGKEILNPDNQVYPYRRWPFVVMPHYLLPHMWQGTDGVQLYKDTQDMINTTVSHLTNAMKTFGDPKILVERGAIDTPGRKKRHYKIGAAAGAVVRLVTGGLKKIKIIDPVSPSASALALYALFTQEFKNIIGLQDPARGQPGPKGMTATESTFLQISSHDRIGLQSVYEDEWVKEVAFLFSEICRDNYDEGRIVRIIGEDQVAGVKEITQRMKDIKFDVSIVPGTTLPFDPEKRIAKYKMAYDLLGNPAANPMLPEMLRVLEIPGWQKILSRYEPWVQFVQLLQLYEAVKAGEIEPKEAVRVIANKAVETFQQQQLTEPQPAEKEGAGAR